MPTSGKKTGDSSGCYTTPSPSPFFKLFISTHLCFGVMMPSSGVITERPKRRGSGALLGLNGGSHPGPLNSPVPAHVAACSLLPFLLAELCPPQGTGRSQVHIRVSDNASVGRFPKLAAQKQELTQLKAFQVTKAACKAGEKLLCRLNSK